MLSKYSSLNFQAEGWNKLHSGMDVDRIYFREFIACKEFIAIYTKK
jgi:hypothetical protein